MNIMSQKYGPSDFSVGLTQEMLITLGKQGFSPEMAKQIVNVKSGWAAKIVELFFNQKQLEDQIIGWLNFYRTFSGISVDLSKFEIPEKKKPGFDRLIVVAEGLTPNQLYDKCAEKFNCHRYRNDLDKAIVHNDRDSSKGSYAIWVRDRVEADEELNDVSADWLKEREIPGITLLERLLYELKYFSETGKHLDIENRTLCSGSRDLDGHVPYAHWWDVELRVVWYSSYDQRDNVRTRAVIS